MVSSSSITEEVAIKVGGQKDGEEPNTWEPEGGHPAGGQQPRAGGRKGGDPPGQLCPFNQLTLTVEQHHTLFPPRALGTGPPQTG